MFAIVFLFLAACGYEISIKPAPPVEPAIMTDPIPAPTTADDPRLTALRRLVVSVDQMHGITRYDDGSGKMLLAGSQVFGTDTCAGKKTFLFFRDVPSENAWNCGGISGGFSLAAPLDLMVHDVQPTKTVRPFEICGEHEAMLAISEDRSVVILSCSNGHEEYYEDGAFYRYSFP